MSLKSELHDILSNDAEILDLDPLNSKSGPAIYQLVLEKLTKPYARNAVLNTISGLAKDPQSPVAKVDSGYGYFRRPQNSIESLGVDGVIDDRIDNQEFPEAQQIQQQNLDAQPEYPVQQGLQNKPEEKFRAFYMRWQLREEKFPRYINHLQGERQVRGINKWKFPDVVLLDWEVASSNENGEFKIDVPLLEIKKSLGDSPFRLTSVELKVDASPSRIRENFFQCVSNSKWAHYAHLVIAESVDEDLIVNEIRRLGSSFGVFVVSFGFSPGTLNAMPDSEVISTMQEDDFERLISECKPNVKTITSAPVREYLDWGHVEDLRANSSDFRSVFNWISKCLNDGNPYTFEKYEELMRTEAGLRQAEEAIARLRGNM